jgi:cytoskeletal protein RodZ
MQSKLKSLAAVIALAIPGVAVAQAQPAQQSTSTTTQQTPDETQTTTTRSTTTAVPGTTATPAQTQTTTTQSTTTVPTDATTGAPVGPPQRSTTTATTTTNAGASQAATAADVKKGVAVYDQSGGLVGKIDSVAGKNAVLNTGSVRATIPIASFAKNDKGLVIGMTKADIDAQAKRAAPKPKRGA